MRSREISIAFQTNKSSAEYISLARRTNQYGFDVVSVYCDLPYQPSFGPLFIMAPHIKESRIGPAAVSPSRMHPLDIAANAALLSPLAEGGIYIGLARGAWLYDYGIKESPKPIQGIREATYLIRKTLSGYIPEFHGEVFQISRGRKAPYPTPSKETPLLIGTWGQRLSEVAGEIADEVKVGGSANPEFAKYIKERINLGEDKAERNKNSVNLVVGAVTVVDEDRERARMLAKEALVLYLPVVAALDKTLTIPIDLIDRIRNEYETGQLKTAAKLIPDDLLDKFAFAGTPTDLINQSEALFDAGVKRVEFGTPHGINPHNGIDLIGRKVLPYLSNHWKK